MTTALDAAMTKQSSFSMAATCLQTSKGSKLTDHFVRLLRPKGQGDAAVQ